jgi:alpha-soluble NSF attachment protein
LRTESGGYWHLRSSSRFWITNQGKYITIQILETVADKYMQSKLTAPSAKELYFKSVLLFLANDDAIGAGQALQRYLNNDPTFFNTRQQKFVQALITSVKNQDVSLFSNEW